MAGGTDVEPKSIVVSDNVETLREVTAEAASEFDQEKCMSVSSKAAGVCSVRLKRKWKIREST